MEQVSISKEHLKGEEEKGFRFGIRLEKAQRSPALDVMEGQGLRNDVWLGESVKVARRFKVK